MKILHVTKKYPNALGGDAVVVSNIQKCQEKRGDNVAILTSNCDDIVDDKHIYKFGLKDTPANLDKITIKRLVSLVVLIARSYKILKTEKPDVIHTHSIDMAYCVSFAARHYKIPMVHTFHVVTFNDPKQQGVRSKVELWLLRHAKVARILVLNPSDSIDFKKKGFQNVTFVPNGVNTSYWRVKKPIKNKVFTFVAVGRLEEQKGFNDLIKAASILYESTQDFNVIIAGEGSQHKQLQSLISNLELNSNVTLVGRKTASELKELYACSHVFVLSSLWEGMPLTLLEAWASGMPTICSKMSITTFMAKGVSELYTISDIQGLATSMIELMKDKTKLDKLAVLSLRAAQNYTWDNTAQLLSIEYKKLLS